MITEHFTKLAWFALFILVTHAGRSLVMSGMAYFLLYKSKFKEKLHKKKLNPKWPDSKIVAMEFKYTMLYTLYFVFWDTLAYHFFLKGQTLIYTDLDKYGLWYLPISFVLVLITNDAYFYWCHRYAHSKHGRWVGHHIHHKSHNPTPWGGLSMSVAEGNIQIAYHLLIVFLIPMHVYVIVAYFFYAYFVNIIGHSGYEFSRYKTRILNNATIHFNHHRYNQGNFALYFQFWDRVMKTAYSGETKPEKV